MFLDWFWRGRDVDLLLSILGLWVFLFIGIFVIPKWSNETQWGECLAAFILVTLFPMVPVLLGSFLLMPIPLIITFVCLYLLCVVLHKIYTTKFPS
ncbi:hypothetical protein S14_6 [Shewanella sp. phage 1/4]|uniref:hypothetical protein n=1 Tax=Shewanella phage 1/4 TaxID=1458859 RepID=UPI0004F6C965|nr:hypothetical protein S14_6 [Shewanella sp. phage 1/4]AHK11118.1 hypothetical protein S14_6 [Shewanella sp. phage 1/4]